MVKLWTSGCHWNAQLLDKRIRGRRCPICPHHHGASPQPCKEWSWYCFWDSSKTIIFCSVAITYSLCLLVSKKWSPKIVFQSYVDFKLWFASLNWIYYQVRTHFARPNWKKVFSKMCSKHYNGRIGQLASMKHMLVLGSGRTSSVFLVLIVLIRIRGILLWGTCFGQRTWQAVLRVQWKRSYKIWVPQGAFLKEFGRSLLVCT